MIYVDEIAYWPGSITKQAQRYGQKWCHLWCDSGKENELHLLARRIGLKKEWFQHHKFFDHYDLTPSKRELAIREGATPIKIAEWMLLQKR